jgi:hypothetical protein
MHRDPDDPDDAGILLFKLLPDRLNWTLPVTLLRRGRERISMHVTFLAADDLNDQLIAELTVPVRDVRSCYELIVFCLRNWPCIPNQKPPNRMVERVWRGHDGKLEWS